MGTALFPPYRFQIMYIYYFTIQILLYYPICTRDYLCQKILPTELDHYYSVLFSVLGKRKNTPEYLKKNHQHEHL